MTRRQSVLVVEDDAELRRMFRMVLSLDGFDVREAGDGLQALRQLETDPPDVVLLDLGLPFVTGHVVLQEIAAHAHSGRIPVVVVTGSAGEHDKLDVACVLRKPVTPDRIVAAVRNCLAAGTGAAGV